MCLFNLKGDKMIEDALIKYYGGKAQYSGGKLTKIGDKSVTYSAGRIYKVGGNSVTYSCGKITKIGAVRI